MPVYVVVQTFLSDPKAAGQTKERLIEAKNKARAVAMVAAGTITAETATIEDAMRLGAAGVKVERDE